MVRRPLALLLAAGCACFVAPPAAPRRLQVARGAQAEDSARRDVLADWAQNLFEGVGGVLAAGAAFYFGAKVAVINQPQRPKLQGKG